MTSAFDLQVAARTLAQEARGEPADGQYAVAWTLKNRLNSGRWGKSLASVCLWRAQFSGWYSPNDPNFAYACNLPDNDPVLLHMTALMQQAFDADHDPTGGALFYHANSMPVPPIWAGTMRLLGQFGHQSFYTDHLAPAITET